MIFIPGYNISKCISETNHSMVCRAYKNETGYPVIIKVFKTRPPSTSEVAQIWHEHDLFGSLEIEGLVKILDIVYTNEQWALIMEDCGGVSLREFLETPLYVSSFLDFAIRVVTILSNLHKHNIAHRNIKPSNILYNSQNETLKLVDFGIVAELSSSGMQIDNLRLIEETLPYISPEQTGRMNCAADYRTDFYSLGAIFYEMLTGTPPFTSHEPIEIIHSHIAKTPYPPQHLNTEIPEVLSDIVIKLLAKAAEERYQSTQGLLADLEHCRHSLKSTGQIDAFEIGSRDVLLNFTIPQLLVGREEEVQQLLDAFERASRGYMVFMLVEGESGEGKTAVVNEMEKYVTSEDCFFLAGKYDQQQRHLPYNAIVQAFQHFARSLLAASEQEISNWREKLLSALSPNVKVITDIIPEIELITGEQPEVPELGPQEARNRFKRVFKSFLQVFAAKEHPLVLFLDDLQWADPSSIDLLRDIVVGGEVPFLLLIGAFRDSEVPEHHPLRNAIDKVHPERAHVERIHLTSLEETEVNHLLADFLRCPPDACAPLAAVIQEKTLGNPFFVTRFLKNLHENKSLELDASGNWQWDLASIRDMQVTDNVVDFMAQNIQQLPQEAFDLMKVCACAGSRFEAWTLAEVEQKPIGEVIETIKGLVDKGLIVHKGAYYAFNHDRIHEAAYSLITGDEREQLHYRIGNLALRHTSEEDLATQVFYIADQLNQGSGLLATQAERTRLAEINLQAGAKAKDSAAYDAAINYLKAGLELLPPSPWQVKYRLMYDLCRQLMECLYLAQDFDGAQQLFETIIANASSRLDKIRVYNVMILLYTSSRSPVEATKLGLEALRLFGLKWSINTRYMAVLVELARVKLLLRKKDPEAILDIPMIRDKEQKAYHNLLNSIAMPAYYVSPKLFALLNLRNAAGMMKHGLHQGAAVTFMSLANIFENIQGDYELAYRMGELALKLNERIDNRRWSGNVNHLFAFFIQHWKKHARYDIDIYKKVYQLCLEEDNLIFAGHSVNATTDCRLMIGDNLDEIMEDSEYYRDFIRHMQDSFIESRYQENLQMVKCLKGLTNDRRSLSDEEFDEKEHLKWLYREKNLYGLCFALLYKMKLLYLYGNYEEASKTAAKLDRHIHVPIGTLLVPEHYFYYSLILSALLKYGALHRKLEAKRIISKYQRQMDKWARLCPENFRHKHDLVQAEFMAAKGDFLQAMLLYHDAVKGARQNGYLHEEAIACERTALFYHDLSAEEEAMAFLQKAHQCYESWGAVAKLQDLEERWPALAHIVNKTAQREEQEGSTILARGSQGIDLTTVMQVSQEISAEIVLDNLLENIMQISIANAGAQRGVLLLDTDGNLTIEAVKDLEQEESLISESIPLVEYQGLSRAIVYYVWRSHEPVLLSNASIEGPFVKDPYIKANQCKSVLCMPILNKGQLSAILYMENNLAANVFTEDRLEILGVIASQAAVSLENARLFEQATTDGLTRLYVHRYFQLFLDQEISRCMRYERTCGLVIMDIDDFKHFNDVYGHPLGDEILKKVAMVMAANTRSADIAARYGGEEFVLVLPETGIDESVVVAEKIRKVVENMEIVHGSEKLRVTISLGVAVYPDHAASKDDLIQAADSALYLAKRSGKNRVCTFHGQDPGLVC